MEPKAMKKLLEDAFKACPAVRELAAQRTRLQEAITTAHARELMFSDRSESLAAVIESTESTIAGLAVVNTDFDKLSKDRAALRAAKIDLADIEAWRGRIADEIGSLKAEYADLSESLADAVFTGVSIPVFNSVNTEFKRQAEALGRVCLDWELIHADFRRAFCGGQKAIRLTADANSEPGRALQRAIG